jgi:hypothetical protein
VAPPYRSTANHGSLPQPVLFAHTPVEGGQQAAASSGSVHSSTSLIGMARMAHNG